MDWDKQPNLQGRQLHGSQPGEIIVATYKTHRGQDRKKKKKFRWKIIFMLVTITIFTCTRASYYSRVTKESAFKWIWSKSKIKKFSFIQTLADSYKGFSWIGGNIQWWTCTQSSLRRITSTQCPWNNTSNILWCWNIYFACFRWSPFLCRKRISQSIRLCYNETRKSARILSPSHSVKDPRIAFKLCDASMLL